MEENRNIAAKGSRHASPRGNSRNTINHTNGSENAVEGRHERRPSEMTVELMSACEVRRRELGLTFADVGRAVKVHRADVSRALRLTEEPTERTKQRLCSFFNVSEYADLKRDEVRTASLYELAYHSRRIAEVAERLMEPIGKGV